MIKAKKKKKKKGIISNTFMYTVARCSATRVLVHTHFTRVRCHVSKTGHKYINFGKKKIECMHTCRHFYLLYISLIYTYLISYTPSSHLTLCRDKLHHGLKSPILQASWLVNRCMWHILNFFKTTVTWIGRR